jgi:hypothetical protein
MQSPNFCVDLIPFYEDESFTYYARKEWLDEKNITY